jgi:hypothetical protein
MLPVAARGIRRLAPFSSFFHDPHSSLAKILACFFPLILWWTVGGLLFESISLSLSFIGLR